MKAMGAILASKGITDRSKVTAIVMLADAYRKVRNVKTSAAIYCREMVVLLTYLQYACESLFVVECGADTREV